MKKPLLTTVFFLAAMFCFAQSGSINVTSVQQRNDGSGLVDVHFNLNGDGVNYYVQIDVSFNAGSSYSAVHSTYTSGDVGPINPGSSKHIIWNAFLSHPNQITNEAMLKITATTGVFPNTGQPCPGTPTVTYEGKTYNTVLIGSQCWLKENLNVGIMLQGNIAQSNNDVIEKYCYGNDIINCEIYGGLYQWNEMMQYVTTEGVQGICPPGWHIPTDDEWKILEGNIDSQYGVGNTVWDATGSRGFDVGKNAKSVDNWTSGIGTDYYGFSVLPAGNYLQHYSNFLSLSSAAYFWTSSNHSSTYAYLRSLGNSNLIFRDYRTGVASWWFTSKAEAYSVRCIKD